MTKILLFVIVLALLATPLQASDHVDSIQKLVQQGKLQEAKNLVLALSKTIEFSSADLIKLCDLLEDNSQVATAIQMLEEQNNKHALIPKIKERLVDFYLQQDQGEKAIPVYKQLTQFDPDNRTYWLQLGQLYTWEDQQANAITAYEQALRLDAADVPTMKKLNDLYIWNDRAADALLLQKTILKQEPDNLSLWKQHGILARGQQDYPEAIQSFQHILRKDPGNSEAFLLLGETYLWTDRQNKAEICFRQVLNLDPGNTQARFYYAQVRQWQPNGWWEAKKQYQQVLSEQPGNKDSRKYLNLIRENYGPNLSGTGSTIHDSNDLTKTEIIVLHNRYLAAQWEMKLEMLYRFLEESKPAGNFSSYGQGAQAGFKWHAGQKSRWQLVVGAMSYNHSEVFPLARLQYEQTLSDRGSFPGRLYSTSALQYDQVLDGVLAIQNEYHATRFVQEFYWEPDSVVHVGFSFNAANYSDNNQKNQLVLTTQYQFFGGNPAFFLEGLYSYEDMRIIYPAAQPYWTPDNFWTRSLGIASRYNLQTNFYVMGGVSFTQQSGNEFAFNWKAEINWQPSAFSQLFIKYNDYGSRYYSYQYLQAGFSYRF